MELTLILVGLSMILFTILPILQSNIWWIRIFDFPRLQIIIILAIILGAYFSISAIDTAAQVIFIGILLASLIYQCYMIFPYTPLARRQVQHSKQVNQRTRCRLFFANVLMNNRQSASLREQIRQADPDIILAVETDLWWQQELNEFAVTHPFTVHYPLDNTYGMLLYSRFELNEAEVKFLVEDDIPSIHALVLLPNGEEVALHCLHPRPPFPTEAMESTERDAEILLVGRMIKQNRKPAIVMGDLNDVAWSYTNYLFQDISGLLDPRIGRGLFNTFHAQMPLLRFPLDHFFHSNHFRLIELKRLQHFGSDHFPVLITLSYEVDAAREQEQLQAAPEQVQEATERIAKAQARVIARRQCNRLQTCDALKQGKGQTSTGWLAFSAFKRRKVRHFPAS